QGRGSGRPGREGQGARRQREAATQEPTRRSLTVAIADQNEDGFRQQVMALAKLYGWRRVHFRPARAVRGRWVTAVEGDGVGFPDVQMLRGPHQLVTELKVDEGRLTADQDAWLKAFSAAGVPAYAWRPEDWPEIERVIRYGPQSQAIGGKQ